MKIFIDTANLKDIEDALKRGFVRGITTNPSLLAKEPKAVFEDHIKEIVHLIEKYQPGIHLSVEVFSKIEGEILSQAQRFRKIFKYDYLSVKVQVGWNELSVVRKLKREGFSVNCTCCMSVNQAVMAAAAGARYVSLFVGRIRDGGTDDKFKKERENGIKNQIFSLKDFNPWNVISATRKLLDNSYLSDVEIIAGSMRSIEDIKMSALSGAHIVTVPPKFFPDMIGHFKTDEVINQFLTDFKNWIQ